MGRFESNSLAPRPSHHPPRDSRDLDGRLSGSLAAFKFAIRAQCKTIRSDSFRNDFAPHPILLFQKMRGWLRMGVLTLKFGLSKFYSSISHRQSPDCAFDTFLWPSPWWPSLSMCRPLTAIRTKL